MCKRVVLERESRVGEREPDGMGGGVSPLPESSTRFYASSVLLIYEGAEYIRVDEGDNKVRVLNRPSKRAL